jgi:uncharacterized membrane protein
MLLIHILQETNPSILSPVESGAEGMVSTVVLWLILLIEAVAAILIGVGVALTLVRLVNVLLRLKGEGYEKARLTLARFLAVALEFQLAADVLATAVAPSWTQIGKLGAIAVIRTALNYFLAREIKEEEKATSEAALTGSEALLSRP